MERIYRREIGRIVSNFSYRTKLTGYRIEPKSNIFRAIADMMKRDIIECVCIKGHYAYVSPSETFKVTMGLIEPKVRDTVPSLIHWNLNWRFAINNSRRKPKEIITS